MRFLLIVALALAGGCAKRAPTTFELDQRAGFGYPPQPTQYVYNSRGKPSKAYRKGRMSTFAEPLTTTSAVVPDSRMPARVAPVVRKIWVSDQLMDDGTWVQGTWMFVEVEPARWLAEVDPGGAPFATEGGAQ